MAEVAAPEDSGWPVGGAAATRRRGRLCAARGEARVAELTATMAGQELKEGMAERKEELKETKAELADTKRVAYVAILKEQDAKRRAMEAERTKAKEAKDKEYAKNRIKLSWMSASALKLAGEAILSIFFELAQAKLAELRWKKEEENKAIEMSQTQAVGNDDGGQKEVYDEEEVNNTNDDSPN
uniref:Uncharacterized protein n=1 Tax=Oryza rufipogon TaxID=4529 RepID=A0A0E0QR37_ORYRU